MSSDVNSAALTTYKQRFIPAIDWYVRNGHLNGYVVGVTLFASDDGGKSYSREKFVIPATIPNQQTFDNLLNGMTTAFQYLFGMTGMLDSDKQKWQVALYSARPTYAEPPPPAAPPLNITVCSDENCKAIFNFVKTIYNESEDRKKTKNMKQSAINTFLSIQTALTKINIPQKISDEPSFNSIIDIIINIILDGFEIGTTQKFTTTQRQQLFNSMKNDSKVPKFVAPPAPATAATTGGAAAQTATVSKETARLALNQLASAYDNLSTVAKADIENIRAMLNNSQAIDNIDSTKSKLDAEIKEYDSQIAKHATEKDALDQQFIDERKTPSKIKKPKVKILQDYILAAFVISYILAGFIGIVYFTSNAESWVSGLLLSTGIFIVFGGIIYSAVLYIA